MRPKQFETRKHFSKFKSVWSISLFKFLRFKITIIKKIVILNKSINLRFKEFIGVLIHLKDHIMKITKAMIGFIFTSRFHYLSDILLHPHLLWRGKHWFWFHEKSLAAKSLSWKFPGWKIHSVVRGHFLNFLKIKKIHRKNYFIYLYNSF